MDDGRVDRLSQAEPVSRLGPTGFDPARRWEALCLADDPFAGDYGGSGSSDGVLSDNMVTNRKGGNCSTCGEMCKPGTRNRVRAEVYDGEFMRFRWCEKCSFGMAIYNIRPSYLDRRIAIATEAGTAATVKQGAVHEGAGRRHRQEEVGSPAHRGGE